MLDEARFVEYTRYRNAVMIRCLKELSARTRYYFEQHKIRWERRYSKPYPECEGEFGTWGGIKWIKG